MNDIQIEEMIEYIKRNRNNNKSFLTGFIVGLLCGLSAFFIYELSVWLMALW